MGKSLAEALSDKDSYDAKSEPQSFDEDVVKPAKKKLSQLGDSILAMGLKEGLYDSNGERYDGHK